MATGTSTERATVKGSLSLACARDVELGAVLCSGGRELRICRVWDVGRDRPSHLIQFIGISCTIARTETKVRQV